MKLVKPSEAEVGKVYRVVTTTYKDNNFGEGIFKGCLVKVVSKHVPKQRAVLGGCRANPISGIIRIGGYIYYDTWRGIEERFEGPIEDVNQVRSISICPECGVEGERVGFASKCPKCWKVWY